MLAGCPGALKPTACAIKSSTSLPSIFPPAPVPQVRTKMQLQRRAALAAQMGLKAQASAGAAVTVTGVRVAWPSLPASLRCSVAAQAC